MLTNVVALLALSQQSAQPPTPQAAALAPSPVARIELASGPEVTITAGDSMRLNARAVDSAGRPVPNATLRYLLSGGRFEGRVDSTGLVRTGSTGSIVVSVVASVPGAKPFIDRIKVRMVPGPAARIAVTPGVTRVVAGLSRGGNEKGAGGNRGGGSGFRRAAVLPVLFAGAGIVGGEPVTAGDDEFVAFVLHPMERGGNAAAQLLALSAPN